ncbi:MAG: hypothetical protein EZS28_047782, partial [Streblomastix strix]
MKSLTLAQLHKLEIRSVGKNYWMLNKSIVETFDALAAGYPLYHPTDRTLMHRGKVGLQLLTQQTKLKQYQQQNQTLVLFTWRNRLDILKVQFYSACATSWALYFLKSRWVAHELSQEQKDNCVIYAGQLHEQLTFAKRNSYEFIITEEESWILYSYPNAGKWAPKGTLRDVHEKITVATPKPMQMVMFSGKRFWLVDFLPHGIMMNSHVFIDRVLVPTMDEINDEYLDIETVVILHIDTSPVRNSKRSNNYVKDTILHRIDLSAYSPDLAPSDFWLFGDLKRSMKGQRFQEQERLKNFVKGWLAGQLETKL